MKKDNRGFTLIELIICMVIFAIVVASVFGFMLASSRSYSAITNRLNLSLQSQLTMNQLGEYIMNCNAGLVYTNNTSTTPNTSTLYVIDKGSIDPKYDVYVFQLKPDGCIYYGYGKNVATLSGTTFSFTAFAATDLLAENVTSFSVSQTLNSDSTKVLSAAVSIVFTKNSTASSNRRTIALRNCPPISIVQAN